ncbi:MAG: tyrosine--tRNA ligase, partial [Marinobacter sp.]|uniref:tyrosine--tRNA ligase n=1 Tax=Marinobacter sp. TaxID=50741 RepID=UPI00329A06A7
GDPGGRSEERNLLDDETLDHNVRRIKAQLGRIVDLEQPDRGVLVDNREWAQPITVLAFLRDVGKHVTVNQMLARESVKARIASENGISFTEFSYMLLQANDYLWLHEHEDCTIQVGGSDQWGNILSGVDFIRRKRGTAVHGFCWPLLTAADGTKLGKTTGARMWLDPERTSPYALWQHFLQTSDDDVRRQLLTFSLRPVAEIEEIVAAHLEAPFKRVAQRTLADDVVALLHGPSAASGASEAADLLFAKDPTDASRAALEVLASEIPSTEMSISEIEDTLDVLVTTGLASSRGDARRTITDNGYSVNGVKLGEKDQLSGQKRLHGEYLLLARGRKLHHLLRIFS